LTDVPLISAGQLPIPAEVIIEVPWDVEQHDRRMNRAVLSALDEERHSVRTLDDLGHDVRRPFLDASDPALPGDPTYESRTVASSEARSAMPSIIRVFVKSCGYSLGPEG
jgi:hypothetical protein